jgi:hypothetical protein
MPQQGIAFVSGAVVTTTARTILQLLGDTNRSIQILEVGVSFNGTSSTATPATVELVRQSSAGTGLSALVADTDLNKLNDSIAEAFTTTGLYGPGSAEPTTGSPLWLSYVHTQSGYIWRPPAPVYCGGGDRIGLRITNGSASVNGYFIFEE